MLGDRGGKSSMEQTTRFPVSGRTPALCETLTAERGPRGLPLVNSLRFVEGLGT